MATFNNGESLSSVRTKINDAIDKIDGNATISNNIDVSGTLTIDTINETTAAAGVTIDSVLLKDGGATFTSDVSFGDNDKAIFGAGSDLQIYHSGSNSIVRDTGQGDLYLAGDANVYITNSDLGEFKASFTSNGSVDLYYDNAPKFATTSTGIDVTGTVTADGLTVDGNVASITLNNTDTTIGQQRLGEINFDQNDPDGAGAGTVASMYALNRGSSSGFGALVFQTGTASSLADRMRIEYTGSISFYEDTGTTPKFYWDASAESLGIGTSSPAYTLSVERDVDTWVSRLYNTGSDANAQGVLIRTDATAAHDTIALGVFADSAYKMVVRSTGNVGIGTSSPAYPITAYRGTGVASYIVGENGSGVKTAIGAAADNGSLLGTLSSHDLRLVTGGAVAATIDTSGNVGIGTSSPTFQSGTGLEISRSGTASLRVERTGATASSGEFFAGNGQVVVNSVSNTPLIFRTNNTDRMRIDSSGNVGIGTSSPAHEFHVYGSTTVARLEGSSTGVYLNFKDTGGDTVYIGAVGNNAYFETNGSERMRIDSSGNLLHNKTSSNVGSVGTELRAGGSGIVSLIATSSGTNPTYFNRLSSDGAIINLAKDGTTVGSIGTETSGNSDLFIGNGDTGIVFHDGNNALMPYNTSTAAYRDNGIDIGTWNNRFKDLYLSGGVYLGGTGAANKLDDYEEGTWTPSFTYSTSTTGLSIGYSIQLGYYTKIGNIVHFSCDVRVNSFTKGSASGTLQLQGFPFASKNLGNFARPNTVPNLFQWPYTTTAGFQPLFSIFQDGTTKGDLVLMRSNNSSTSLNDPDADSMLFLSGWYYAA